MFDSLPDLFAFIDVVILLFKIRTLSLTSATYRHNIIIFNDDK